MKNSVFLLSIIAACAVFTSGCAMKEAKQNFSQMSLQDLQSAGAKAEKEYNNNPTNSKNTLKYAQILRASGAHNQALNVLEPLAKNTHDDAEILAEYGRVLAGTGQLQSALIALNRASELSPTDWKIHSTRGAVFDQMGQLEQSRTAYQQALGISPNEPSVLSNLALSYALSKDLKNARKYSALAIAQPTSDSRIRQNHALIIGLSGDMTNAEAILKADLPEYEAEQTLSSLKTIISAKNLSYSQLRANQKNYQSNETSLTDSEDENIKTAGLQNPLLVDSNGVIKAPTWDMLMEKPSIKGKTVE